MTPGGPALACLGGADDIAMLRGQLAAWHILQMDS
ncbi:hypothetical protein SAMN05519105_3989 [Rhodobacter sp. 24-YEA-8]|nr:hypothetical protein SAMN05519105_3989 [Rhodobacter sp. 24-YEA-8]